MIRDVAVRELEVGMFVTIPAKWIDHPFLRKSFRIRSSEQLEKLRQAGIEAVRVDFDKSAPTAYLDRVSHGAEERADPASALADRLSAEALRRVVRDPGLSPEKKAEWVYRASASTMEALFADPTARNISFAKRALHEVVDVILANPILADWLVRIGSHDFATHTHSVNVGVLSVLLANAALGPDEASRMRELGAAFFLHDLGKTQVPVEILNKPGPLDETEMRRVREHPREGSEMLERSGELTEECAAVVLQHHERVDGSGYPRRLRGDGIHIFGRICCIADVYDALTADRPYKAKISPFEALTLMREELLPHLTPWLFERFVRLLA